MIKIYNEKKSDINIVGISRAKSTKDELRNYGVKTESLVRESVKDLSDYLKVDLKIFSEDLENFSNNKFETFYDEDYAFENYGAKIDLFTEDSTKYTLYVVQTGENEITMTCKENKNFIVVDKKPSVFAKRIIELLI